MSRSGYSDECEFLVLYRGNVNRAIAGKRGQKYFRELVAALDAMEVKELIAGDVICDDGSCCAIGSIGKQRGRTGADWPADYPEKIAKDLGIAAMLVNETAYMNDEWEPAWKETPAERWKRMRGWAEKNILKEVEETSCRKKNRYTAN